VAEQLPAPPVPQRGRPKRAPDAQRMHAFTIRLSEELLRRLDAYTAQVHAARPYLRVSRANVLRMLLDQELPATR
jgi:hypothetical protein